MAMKYFKLHYDLNKMFKSVSDEQLGQGIRALLIYANSGEPPNDLELGAQIVFDTLSAQFDRDNATYETICERNRKNGCKGGRPKKQEASDKTQKTQTVILETQKSQEKEKRVREKSKRIYTSKDVYKGVPPELLDAFKGYGAMRTYKKKPLTENIVKRVLKKLDRMAVDTETKIAILEQSTDNYWIDVYELKQDSQSTSKAKEGRLDWLDKL